MQGRAVIGCTKPSSFHLQIRVVWRANITKYLSLVVQLLSLHKHSAVASYLCWLALGLFTTLLQSRVLFKSVSGIMREEEEFGLKVFQ